MIIDHYHLLVAGSSQTTLKQEVVAPYDGKLIATIDCADADIVENSLSVAYQLYKDRKSWLPLAKRIEILEAAIDRMSQEKNKLALESAREGGKPLMDSLVEADRLIDSFKICVEVLRTDQGQVIPMRYNKSSSNKIAFTQKEPIGVVVAVSAFNHPLNLIAHQVGSAISAGCPVIVKPATNTPLSCWRIVNILLESGLPEGWIQCLVIPDNKLAEKLVTDERVGFLSFIGSAKVGWHLRSVLAPGTRCALEHGGVAPAIVAKDAVLENAIPALVKGGFYHAGQVCVSVQRIFVDHSIAKSFTEKLAKQASQLIVGDPTLKETEVGPLINHKETDRIDAWVNEAIEKGAHLVCGGKKISKSCYQSTVLYNPPQDALVSQNEVFGPVVCIYPYKHIEEAMQQANALPYAFQAAVFTENLETMLYVYENIDASAVMINEHTAFRVDAMPFAGLKHSGLGVGGIPYSINDMQIEKMLVMKSKQIY